eukprot:TRINITY_DN3406_c0_g1_i1.p2 TRINITY_DN3406_c0_g1~~TRINITY_DN3406_c0_g1_i1.p2  ORF type:complete len:304 (+),score=23.45 TRINITY_DN3406_c0_g1_i1:1782-2693(+)
MAFQMFWLTFAAVLAVLALKCTALSCDNSNFQTSTSFQGQIIEQQPVNSASSCCSLCSQRSECTAFTMNIGASVCYLYSHVESHLPTDNCISCSVQPIQVLNGTMPWQAFDVLHSLGTVIHLHYGNTTYANYTGIIRPKLLELGIQHVRDGASDPAQFPKYEDLHRAGGLRFILVNKLDEIAATPSLAATLGDALDALEGPNEPDSGHRNHPDAWVPQIRNATLELYKLMKSNRSTANIAVLPSALADSYLSPPVLGDLSYTIDHGNSHFYQAGAAPDGALLKSTWVFRSLGSMRSAATRPFG